MKKSFWALMIFLWIPFHCTTGQNKNQNPVPIFTLTSGNEVVNNQSTSQGGSWADYDMDGDPDLFISAFGNNRLYRNDGNFNFTLIDEVISNDGGASSAAVWGDYNNDGYLDLFVSNNPAATSSPEANFLYQNSGPPDYEFTRILSDAPVLDSNYTWSSSWVDFDNDGDLDLHMPENKHLGLDYFYVNNGVPDSNGNYFTLNTSYAFMSDSVESTGSASWIDYDNDCDQDIFLIKSGRSHPIGVEDHRMFHNNLTETGNLSFQRVITAPLVQHLHLDFQASWGDYDNDGDLDVFLGNFDAPNYLYRNEGDSIFTRITQGDIVNFNTPTLGSSWGDYDNDGDLDLFVNNTAGFFPNYFENDGNGSFINRGASYVGAPASALGNLQSCSNADVNSDGYLDLLISKVGNDLLYRNNGGQNGFIEINLKGTNSNASAIGAKVRIGCTINGTYTKQMRFVSGNPTGDKAQNSLRIHFGIGDAVQIDTMIIEWPLCSKDTFTNLNINSICDISEDGAINCRAVLGNTNENSYEENIIEIYPNPANENFRIQINEQIPSIKIELTGINGKIYKRMNLSNTSFVEVNTSELESGMYFIKTEMKNQIILKKIMIQ